MVMQKVNFMHEENGKYNRQISTHMRTGKIGIGMCMNYSKASVDQKSCTGRRGLNGSQHAGSKGDLSPDILNMQNTWKPNAQAAAVQLHKVARCGVPNWHIHHNCRFPK